jgi:hypothetical protein
VVAERLTLEEIGRMFVLTRERVRQIENRLKLKLAYSPTTHSDRELGRNLAEFRVLCKFGCELNAVEALLGCIFDREALAFKMFLSLAGTYELDDRFVFSGSRSDFMLAAKQWLREKLGPDASIKGELMLDAQIAGFPPALFNEFLTSEPDVRLLGEHVLLLEGTLADKVASLLTLIGQPTTPEELAGLTARAEGTVRNVLCDDRFTRVNQTHYGLASWGFEPYTTTHDLIVQYILQQGGSAIANDAVTELTSKYGASEKTVRAGFSHPAISYDRMTRTIRLAKPGNTPRGFNTHPAFTGRLYKFSETWYYKFDINSERLRGSGSPIRLGAAGLLDLRPQTQIVRAVGDAIVYFIWPGIQPTITSLSPLIVNLEMLEGDILYLECGPNPRADSFVVRKASYELDMGLLRAAKSLGFEGGTTRPPTDSELLHFVAKAIDVDVNEADLRHAIRLRLSHRNEPDMLELIPAHGVRR